MAKLRLTEEEKIALIDALNNETEPDPVLVPKLFPSTAEKFDVVSLDRAKVPTLEYAGKRSKAAILAEASAGIGAAPLQIARCFGDVKDDEWQNMIVQGDNLQFLKTCYRNEDELIENKVKGKVKLIYIDPPFATGDEYGGSDGEHSYTAKVAGAEFVEAMRTRLIYLKPLMAKDASIFMRIDYHFSHALKLVMDEVFGKNQFKNEIVINRFKRQQRGLKKFNNSTESLFLYAKGDAYFQEQERGRLCSFCGQEKDPEWRAMISSGLRNPPERTFFGVELLPPRGQHWKYIQEKIDKMTDEGRVRINEKATFTDLKGNKILGMPEFLQTEDETVDNNWTDLRGYAMNSKYPTENHEELLERVIKTASKEGDLVLDVFAGSGTTAVVSEKLNRRWIVADFGKHAIYTMQKRIMRISASAETNTTANKVITSKSSKKYRKEPKPFCVLSSGAYDFSHIMELREHKDRYVNFVLGLFQLSRDEKMTKKFKSDIVFAEKNGHPVEVYPVWQDEFLKEVRIDEEYLEGIITQSGGKLKGEYFIITPETCTNVGDTTLKNDNGDEVTFRILTFPYKVLEDVSRKLTLQDQPSKPDDVNQLVSSTAFYFNEDVELEVKRTDGGLQITHFATKILDSEGNRFEGYQGLAMLLVDDAYEPGKPFDMDKTVFLKDIKEDGTFTLAGLGESVGVIAIDKHGNESKPVTVV